MRLFPTLQALAFDGVGNLFAAWSENGSLYQVDTTTSIATQIATTGESLSGLAFDPLTGVLWASTSGNEDKILTINVTTGETTLIGLTGRGGPIEDIAFDINGNLYANKFGEASDTLIAIDKTTGAGTIIGPVGFSAVFGMATRLDRVVVGIADEEPVTSGLPRTFSLAQNYPNPFNPSTTIQYDLAKAVHVKLVIYDILGRKVRTLVDENQVAGSRQITWDGRSDAGTTVASGLYIYRIIAGDPSSGSGQGFIKARKLMLIR